MGHHLQIHLACTMTEAVVTPKRAYYHVEFRDFGMTVKVGKDARFRGDLVRGNEQLVAFKAVECLEALEGKRAYPVLQQALACNTASQRWALEKLGLPVEPRKAFRESLEQARGLVGEVASTENRVAFFEARAAKEAAKYQRERARKQSDHELAGLLEEFFQSEEHRIASAQIRAVNEERWYERWIAAGFSPEEAREKASRCA